MNKKIIINNIILLIISLIGFVFMLNILPAKGAVYSHDSVAYSYAAKSLINGDGIKYFGYKTPVIQWPPVYILILIIPIIFSIKISQFALVLNSLIFMVLIFISGKWMLSNLINKWLAYIGILFIFFSIPIIHISKHIWTEPLFILLVMVSIISFQKYKNTLSMKWLIISGLLSASCWLTRYTGIVVLITCCIIILVRIKPIKKKIKHLFTYGIIAALPMLLWVLRNFIISRTITGGRTSKITPIVNNINKSLHIFYSWFIDKNYKKMLIGIIILVVIIMTSIILICIRKKQKKFIAYLQKGCTEYFLFAILYYTVIIISESRYAIDPINNRLLSPVFIPILFVVLLIIDALINQFEKNKKILYIINPGIILALLLIVNYPVRYHINNMKKFHNVEEGIAYSNYIIDNETLKYIEHGTYTKDTILFSNNPTILTYHTDIDSRWMPKKEGIKLYDIDSFNNSIKQIKEVYIVWFGDKNSTFLYTINDISKIYQLKLIKKLTDGYIYKIIK
ncbi:glycosyltransferase family 39 protein [Vallitalea sp.]|uniref:glycosyltransferase family 39 protein n=1 Tax=Vallitalea sp. TaxID=1882829 RepID=UPI0025CE03FE|nr:glycosyltransferase family 39 protein [Vallitalea sp.]MCT4686477.1 glycosyltransferase family 39 protein [Vallitalea sp.]